MVSPPNLVKEAGIPDWGGRLYLKLQAAFNAFGASVAPSVPITTFAGLDTNPSVNARGYVSDSATVVFHDVAVGGGTSGVPVYYDGTNWRVG